MQPIVSWAPIGYASSVGFDVVILILTLAKVNADRMQQSSVGRQIYRDSVLYFLATAITNITVLSIQGLGPEHDMIKPTAVPFSTVVTVSTLALFFELGCELTCFQVAMAQRVFLNLKLFNQRRQREAAGLPMSAPSQSSHGSFPRPPPPPQAFAQAKRSYLEDASSSRYEAKAPEHPPREVVYISRQTVVDHR